MSGCPILLENPFINPKMSLRQRNNDVPENFLLIEWSHAQRKASLLIPPYNIDEWQIMTRFSTLYHNVVNTVTEQCEEKQKLLDQIIQESILIEWPKVISGLSSSDKNVGDDVSTEIDFAPLIHRARSVVKCRTPHPTMRVRVCALSDDDCGQCRAVKEALFRVTLVKLSGETSDYQVAGKLILTQREGTPATKCQDQNGAMMTSDGRLIASQAASDVHSSILLENAGETCKTTPLKYELGTLCATFPEMGVTLNSMVDRRQLATRYAMQVHVEINIDNKNIVKHVVQSHPFLIAITNDQTEPLLTSIFWQRLLNTEQVTDASCAPECSTKLEPSVPWKIVREVLKNFVKAQYPPARSLCIDEILHLQSMLFLPRVTKCCDIASELALLENELYGNVTDDPEVPAAARLCNRLGQEEVNGEVLVAKHEFMQGKCVSLADMQTPLRHSLWQWLYRATEMIMDVGHKLCPSPAILEKKCSKTKRQMAAAEEYQTMLSLFNSRSITFISSKDVAKAYKLIRNEDIKRHNFTRAMIIRFCDENAGHLSFAFTNFDEPSKPMMGSLSAEQIKDFKQGLPEFLFDEAFPKVFEKIVRTEVDPSAEASNNLNVLVIKKKQIFTNYNTLRLQNDCIQTKDNDSIRINPLTGERLAAVEFDLPTSFPTIPQSLDATAYFVAMNIQNLQNLFPQLKAQSENLDTDGIEASPVEVSDCGTYLDEPSCSIRSENTLPTFKIGASTHPTIEKLYFPANSIGLDEPIDLSPNRIAILSPSKITGESTGPSPPGDDTPTMSSPE